MKHFIFLLLFLPTSAFSQFLLIDTVAAYTDSEGIIHAETNKLEFNIHAGIQYYTDYNFTYKKINPSKEFDLNMHDVFGLNAGIRFNLYKQRLWIEGRSKLYTQKTQPFYTEWNLYLDYKIIDQLYARFEVNEDQGINNSNIDLYRSGNMTAIGFYYNYIINNPIEYRMKDPFDINFYGSASYVLNYKYLISSDIEKYQYMRLNYQDAVQSIIGFRLNLFKNYLYFEQNIKIYTSINGWISMTPFYSDYTTMVDARFKAGFLRLSHTCYHPVAGDNTIDVDAISGSHTSIGVFYNLIR
jgi:hypothetical protein